MCVIAIQKNIVIKLKDLNTLFVNLMELNLSQI